VLFEDEQDLIEKIEDIFHYLDNDDSGAVNYQELYHGLKFMKLRNQISSEVIQGIHFTYDDFEVLTEQGKLLGLQDAFSKDQFTQMMMGELKRYSQRQLRNAVLLSRSQEFIPTIMLSKLTQLANKQSTAQVDQDSGAIQIQQTLAAIKLEITHLAHALTFITSFLPHAIKDRGPSSPFHLPPAYHLPRQPLSSSHASKLCTHGKEEQLEGTSAAENLQNPFTQTSVFTEDLDVEEVEDVETLRQKLKILRSEVARKDAELVQKNQELHAMKRENDGRTKRWREIIKRANILDTSKHISTKYPSRFQGLSPSNGWVHEVDAALVHCVMGQI
jgi:hypothetical protein